MKSADTNQDRYNDTYNQAYQVWGNFYQNMMEEGVDFLRQGMEMAQKMSPLYPDNTAFSVWMRNYQDFMSRVSEEATTAGQRPGAESYQRIYEAWLDTLSRSMETYMQTPEFVSQSGKHLETMSEVHQKMAEAMEAYWHALRLPSLHDMREIYHKLYIIERKIDDLDRRFREQQANMSSNGASAKKTKK